MEITEVTSEPGPPETDSRFQDMCDKQRLWGNEAFRYYHRSEHAWLQKERRIRTQRTDQPTPTSRGGSISGEYFMTTEWIGQLTTQLNTLSQSFTTVSQAATTLRSWTVDQ